MENININIERAKLICSGKITLDKEHKINSFTTINTTGYFRYLGLNNKSLLTNGKSSDEVFIGAFYGAKDITLMENNPYVLYYYYLKLAALQVLNCREFEWFFYKYVFNKHPNNKMFSKRMFKRISPILKELNEDAFNFFNELFDEFNHRIIRERLFNDAGYHRKVQRAFDIFLMNDKTYDRTKVAMRDVDLNFQEGDILTDKITDKYDVINLSSLCTTNPLHKMINLYKRLDENNLNDDGLIILGYLWNNNMYTEDYSNVWKNIYQDPDSNRFINKYLSDVYHINGYRDYLWEDCKKGERVLIYKRNRDQL